MFVFVLESLFWCTVFTGVTDVFVNLTSVFSFDLFIKNNDEGNHKYGKSNLPWGIRQLSVEINDTQPHNCGNRGTVGTVVAGSLLLENDRGDDDGKILIDTVVVVPLL